MKSRISTQTEEKIIDTIRSLSFEMTRRCNMNCDFCARGKAQNVTITKEIIDKTLDEMKDIYIYDIRLSGGEPFLAVEQIEYIVNEIIRRKFYIDELTVFTNGTIRSSRIAAALKKIAGYIKKIRSIKCDSREFTRINTEFNYSGAENKCVGILISTEGHNTTERQVNDTIQFYKTEIDDDENVALLNQAQSFKYDRLGIAIEGNALVNFDKLFGEVVPRNAYSIDNNYRFIKRVTRDNKAICSFIGKTISISANGNIFPGATMPYERVDKEKMFSIFDCDGDFMARLESFCWVHPLNPNANNIRRQYKIMQLAQSRGRKMEGFNDRTGLWLGYYNSRVDRLEEVMRDMHRILPNLDYDEIEGVATATVMLEMYQGGEQDEVIKTFAKICTEFDDDTISRLSLEWCQGFIKYLVEKDKQLGLAAAQQ